MKTYFSRLSFVVLIITMLTYDNVFSQNDFREETIYFLLTSRFNDGDPNNNAPTEWSSYNPDPDINPSITDPNDVTWRGDFKGLIQKLDYIKDMGFTAIWITPIVHNRSPLDYHGYHAWDFTRVDPRLESPGATFQDLINEVHAKGMKIVLDVVTNHAGRFGIKDVAEIKYNTDPTKPWAAVDNPNWEYDGITPNPDDGLIWSRANLAKMPAPYNQNLAAYNFPGKESYVDTSDPDWYHHSGNGFAQGFDDIENLHNRALAGDTPDLNTSSPKVREYLVNAYRKYIEMGVDAFRWDTLKHMSKEDVLYFFDAFKAINPNLFIFGEVAQKRHELHPVEEINPHYYTWRGAVNNSAPLDLAVIDFYGEATFHGTFEEGQSFPTVKAAARYDHLYSDPSTLVTWLDNHDFGPNNDWNRRYGGSDENLAACMNFMFTWRGIPTVYYGTEMRFKAGEFADIHNAAGIQESIDNTGRAYYGDVMDQAPSHKIYQQIKKLNAMRRAIPALQKGSWEWKEAPGNAVSYKRVHGNSEVVVGLAKDGGASFSITGVTDGVYRDAVTGRETFASGGRINFSVTSGSAGVYVLNGPGLIGPCGGGYFESCVNGPSKPIVTINSNTIQSENPIQVSMEAYGGSGSLEIFYTTDNSNPNQSSNRYTSSFTINSSSTVKAIAFDSNGIASDIVTQNFTIGPIQGLHVYFKKPDSWSQVNVHYWNESPDVLPASNWPGPEMNQIGNTDWYEYIFNGVTSTNLLFNDNGNAKTDDLVRAQDGWFQDDQWFDTDPRDNTTPDDPDPDPVDGITIYYKGNISNPNIYYWNTSPGTATTSWPGENMTDIGNGWFSYTFSNVNCTNLIFSRNGNNQTDDLQRCGDGWYFNGTWHDSNPEEQPTGNDLNIYFKSDSYSNPEIYFWNVTPSNLTTTWPGETMTLQSNGWYKYTFSNTDCSNIIFSNNGSSQTADLNRCSEGWYYNGTWYDSNPDNLQARTNSISSTSNHPDLISIYPNSINENSKVRIGNSNGKTDLKIEVISVYGTSQTLVDTKINSGMHEFKLNEIQNQLINGIYFVRVTMNGKTTVKKIIKK
ncbi:starch-binding protein [Tenacibaculum sp. 190524A05c]|uniref:starch-binding protein n=1 Tax=Tenacibaculum platacis TaxID=3137852 RepID=UPI0032B183D2